MSTPALESLPLILTRLNRPPVPFDLVPRPCLIEWLDHRSQRPLTLVLTPAGYGKSTLISSWLAHFMSKKIITESTESEQ
jgi:LuxR family maltose regulon positive regulatory protein